MSREVLSDKNLVRDLIQALEERNKAVAKCVIIKDMLLSRKWLILAHCQGLDKIWNSGAFRKVSLQKVWKEEETKVQDKEVLYDK